MFVLVRQACHIKLLYLCKRLGLIHKDFFYDASNELFEAFRWNRLSVEGYKSLISLKYLCVLKMNAKLMDLKWQELVNNDRIFIFW